MSYNSLFGLGTHSPDAALEGWWKLDDNAASTAITDYSGNGYTGDMNGGVNTSAATIAGPNGWLSSALDTATYNATLPEEMIEGLGTHSMVWWVKSNGTTSLAAISANSNGRSDDLNLLLKDTGSSRGVYIETGGDTTFLRVDAFTPTLNEWYGLGYSMDNSALELKSYRSGTLSRTQSSYGDSAGLAPAFVSIELKKQPLCHFGIFSRLLSDAEHVEAYAGPEPLNLTAPAVSQSTYTISTTDGTWDSQANGVVNYSYSWEYADDAIGTNPVAINSNASEFSPTPAMAGKFVRVTVSAVNDGGSDPAEDQVSAWTAITAVPRGLSKEVAHWCPSWRDDSAESVVTDYTLNGYGMDTVNMNSSNWIADTSEGGVRALDFNGTNEYCRTDLNNVPYSSLDAQLQTSVSAWVYGELTSTNGNPWAYAKTQGGSSTRRAGYRLVDRGGDEVGECAFSSNDGNSSATVSVKPANGSQPRSTWYHVYAEFEKSAVGDNQNASTRLWLDGVYIGEDSDTTGIFDDEPLHRMFLGQNTRTAGNLETTYFDGRLDDIRFFGEHLTQNEITHLASARGVEGSPGGGGPTFQPAWAFQATVVAL